MDIVLLLQKATRSQAVSFASLALSSFTFNIGSGIGSSEYDQILMKETSTKETVRVHFPQCCITGENLFGDKMQVCRETSKLIL